MQKIISILFISFGILFLNTGFFLPEEDPKTYYYMGEIKAQTPDSVNLGTYVAITKHIVNMKENRMDYQVVSVDQKGETKEYGYVLKVNDPNFVMEDNENNFKGKGKLHGKAWKWTSWDYEIDYTNPIGKMKGKDRVTLWGLMVNKDFYGVDGKKLIHYHERHNFITKEMFEILYLQILKANK